MKNELNRLKERLTTLEPGTEQYNKVLAEYKELYRIIRQTEIDEDKRINDAHHRTLEEKRFQHDQVKFENQLEVDAKKEAFDKERFEFEQRKFEFEQQKFEHQAEVDSKRIELDEEKLKFDEEEREYETSTRYTGRQITRRIIELGAETICTGVLISLIGNLEQTSILSKTAMMFVRKR